MIRELRYFSKGLLLVIGLFTTSFAASDLSTARQLIKGEVDTLREVVDGDTLFLASGLKVRISGIQAPKLSLGREHVTDWPLGHDAKQALLGLTQNKRLGLYYSGERRDRYGRALAQVFTLNSENNVDLYIQEEMLRLGLARVYTWPDTYQDAKRLLKAENDARRLNKGIWGLDYYDIRSPNPDMLAQDVDSFQLVEGIVTSTAEIRGRIYLNFGADYKTDFTVVVDSDARKRFEAMDYDLLELEGAKIRVRGWIELKNGPSIWLTHPEPLELLDRR